MQHVESRSLAMPIFVKELDQYFRGIDTPTPNPHIDLMETLRPRYKKSIRKLDEEILSAHEARGTFVQEDHHSFPYWDALNNDKRGSGIILNKAILYLCDEWLARKDSKSSRPKYTLSDKGKIRLRERFLI